MNKITRVSALLLVLFVAVAVANCKKKAADDAGTTNPAAMMSEEDTAKAKKMFSERCATCHGPEGKGNGPAAAALNPKPRVFSKVTEYKQGSSVEQIAVTIEKGVDGGKTGMVAGLVPDAADRTILAKLIVSEFQKQ